jgi:hypothetical protein
MENKSFYLVFKPGTTLQKFFDNYQKAWEFTEQYRRDGHGVACIEQITPKN